MASEVLEQVRLELARTSARGTPLEVARVLRSLELPVSDTAVAELAELLRRDSVGAGKLDPLLRLPGVTDVIVNGAGEVFCDRGRGLERSEVSFADEAEVRQLAARMAAGVGRRLDDGSPYVDARLADGTRMHAILSPVADPGTCISLRVPSSKRFGLDGWVGAGSISAPVAGLLAALVRAKVAFLICGGTGTGKTTLLASMLAEVDADERLLVVEDSRELRPDHPHCVSLEARAANAEGVGAITLTDLVRQALRMRPDRIVLGEVRGAELCDLLTAFNTGHEGGCGTIHANSALDVPARLVALAALGGMSATTLFAQASAALQVVIQLSREIDGTGGAHRRVAGIHVLEGDSSDLRVVPAVEFGIDHQVMVGPGLERLHGLVRR